MSKAAAKLAKVREERDRLFEAGRFYEALQLYKTLFSRATVKKAYAEARDIAVEGATALLKQKQSNAGGELALLLIELYTKSKQPVDAEQATVVLTLCSAFPAEGHEAKINFLKAAIKWSTTPSSNNSGLPDFHLVLARTYRALPDFPSAIQHYLRSGGASELISHSLPDETAASQYPYSRTVPYTEASQTLLSWAQTGKPDELELFITRIVLQYLCLKDLDGAAGVLGWFREHQAAQAASEPLFHFCEFLVEIVPRALEAAPLFDVLRHKYAAGFARDPSLDAYLDRIGSVYFGRAAPQGFMESLLSGLGGAGFAAAAPAAASPSPAATPAAAAAAVAAPSAVSTPAATRAAVPNHDDPMSYDGPDVD